jgi:ABC-type transport system involved in multi-copper enzyme maturation permease subunit
MSARAGFGGALRSELTKIRSVRSTYWALVATVLVTVLIGALICAFTLGASSGPRSSYYDPTYLSLVGLAFGQLIIAALGAVTFTSEYSTGMIRTSLTVQPRRGTLFAAKATAFTLVSLAAGLVAAFTSFLLGQAILSRRDLGAALGQPHVLRAVFGAGLFLCVSGLLAFGLGALLRYTAGAVAAAIAVLLVSEAMSALLSDSWQASVSKWIPFNAGSQVWSTVSDPAAHMLSPWAGFAVFAGYAAIAVAAGLAAFLRRDA